MKKLTALLLAIVVVALFAYVLDKMSGVVAPRLLRLVGAHPHVAVGASVAAALAGFSVLFITYFRSLKKTGASPYQNPDAS